MTSSEIAFDRTIPAQPGELVSVSPLVRRIIANNPGPMTFTGTCTYVIGQGEVVVIDPGPDVPAHRDALLDQLGGETISTILVTHTHRDHSAAASSLKAATGATVVGCARYTATSGNETLARVEAAHERAYQPDHVLQEGDIIEGRGFSLAAVATPGHTRNHLAFALREEAALFTGDHVMAWSTSVIVPPDGTMGDYMASLDKLLRRDDTLYWPGHGGPVIEPQRFARLLIQHRKQREAAILSCLREGPSTIPALVAAIYQGLDPSLCSAAALSVFAHLEDLAVRALVQSDGEPSLTVIYRVR